MSNLTETVAVAAPPVEDTGMRLTAAQTLAAEALQECNKAAEQFRARAHQLSDDVRVLEELLPAKRAALARAEAEYATVAALLREHFSLYRDLMGMTPDSEPTA